MEINDVMIIIRFFSFFALFIIVATTNLNFELARVIVVCMLCTCPFFFYSRVYVSIPYNFGPCDTLEGLSITKIYKREEILLKILE